MSRHFFYFVEGECEKKLIDIYKVKPHNIFIQGKVTVFNFVNKPITTARISIINRNTTIILVYDTDVNESTTLENNIRKLKNLGFNDIIHIQSIKTFEDELVYSTSVKSINAIFNSQSSDEFKKVFLKMKDESIISKFKILDFNGDLIWSRETTEQPFSKYYSFKHQEIIKQKKKLLQKDR